MIPHPRVTLALAFVLLLLVVVGVLRRPRTTPPVGACTHWASPTGSGSTCTEAAPCQVASWWPLAQPGSVLCLQDGVYTGSASMLSPPDTFRGTETQPITIRALHDGQVLLDGQDARRPMHLAGSWGVVEGINVTRGDNHNLRFYGAHWTARRVGSWDVGAGGEAQVNLGGTHNTLEDCFVFGTGQKQLAAGSSSQTTTHNVVRRCFVQWQDTGDSSNPEDAMEVGYGQNTILAENNLVTYGQTGTSRQKDGVLTTFRTLSTRLLGNIVYVLPSARFEDTTLLFARTDGGSQHAAGTYQPTRLGVIQHNVAYIDPAHPRFSAVRALRFDYAGPGPHGADNTVRANVGVSGVAMSCQSPDYTCTDIQQGTSLAEALGAGKSLWTDSVAAPGLCHRYVGGVLTTAPLWPWPMNQRILDAMTQAGVPPVHVTQTMEHLFGPIPDACRSDRPPPQPEPVPPGATLACVGQISAVPGQVTMQCTPQGEGRRSTTPP